MRAVRTTLAIPTSVAAGAATDANEIVDKTVQISGTFVATIQLQGTIDGSVWNDLGDPITAATTVMVLGTFKAIRVNVTAYSSGTPVGHVSGLMSRTD